MDSLILNRAERLQFLLTVPLHVPDVLRIKPQKRYPARLGSRVATGLTMLSHRLLIYAKCQRVVLAWRWGGKRGT